MPTDEGSGRLEVHVLNAGVGQGESIVLRLPNGEYGVVDCYARDLADPGTNPTVDFLKKRHVEKIEFLCLTHPHADHFRGMSHLLSAFHVHRFWRNGGMSSQDLHVLIAYLSQDAELSGDVMATADAREFSQIHTLVTEQAKRTTSRLRRGHLESGQQLYPRPVSASAAMRMLSLSPSGDCVSEYQSQLHSCFDENRRLVGRFRAALHNSVSVALLIEFGQTRIVLGGDLEEEGWREVLAEFPHERLSCHAIKVPHHGSANGYTDSLWDYFAASGKPIAIITPFLRNGLPEAIALEHIGKCTQEMLVTFAPTATQAQAASAESRMAMYAELAAKPEPRATGFGRCSLVYDDKGNCLDKTVEPPASDISSQVSSRP